MHDVGITQILVLERGGLLAYSTSFPIFDNILFIEYKRFISISYKISILIYYCIRL